MGDQAPASLFGTRDLHFITSSCYRCQPELGPVWRRYLFVKILEEARRKYRFAFTFRVKVLGVDVDVQRVDMTLDGQIVAICRRGKTLQKIPILDLPLPTPAPAGMEWIVAYCHWRRGTW